MSVFVYARILKGKIIGGGARYRACMSATTQAISTDGLMDQPIIYARIHLAVTVVVSTTFD